MSICQNLWHYSSSLFHEGNVDHRDRSLRNDPSLIELLEFQKRKRSQFAKTRYAAIQVIKTAFRSSVMPRRNPVVVVKPGGHQKVRTRIGRTQYSVAYRAAVIQALMSNKEEAFAGLEKAFIAHDWDVVRINVDPFVDSLRDDPRF